MKKKDEFETAKTWIAGIVPLGILTLLITGFSYYVYKEWYPPQIPPKPPPIVQIQKPDLAKLIKEKQPKIDPILAKEIATAIEKYSNQYNFPPELIICLIEKESSFRPMAVSKAGCEGLLQINRKFHKEKLKKLNIKGDQIFHIDNNINVGVMILREYYNKTKTISGALRKYLGINSKEYQLDILASFADLIIKKK